MNTNASIGIFALFFGFTGTVLMAEEKPEAILAAARKLSDNQPWRVEAHVVAEKIDMNISGIINGKDFDLTIDTGDQVRRQIVIGDKAAGRSQRQYRHSLRLCCLKGQRLAGLGGKFPFHIEVRRGRELEDR